MILLIAANNNIIAIIIVYIIIVFKVPLVCNELVTLITSFITEYNINTMEILLINLNKYITNKDNRYPNEYGFNLRTTRRLISNSSFNGTSSFLKLIFCLDFL